MEHEDSLPHSQATATCAYPEPARSSPCLHIPLLFRSIVRLSHLCLGFPNDVLLSGLPTKALYATLLSAMRASCPAHLIFLDVNIQMIFGGDSRSLSSSLSSLLVSPVTSSLLGPNILPRYVNVLFWAALVLRHEAVAFYVKYNLLSIPECSMRWLSDWWMIN